MWSRLGGTCPRGWRGAALSYGYGMSKTIVAP
jgi:hypothetical protein